MKELPYPLTFSPVCQGAPWAGSLLSAYLSAEDARENPPEGTASSWELIDDANTQSVVRNGAFAGATLGELVRQHPREIVGRRHSAEQPFPLCIRMMDVGEQQPLTVHPAHPVWCGNVKAQPNNKFWFSLAATERAQIVAGIGRGVTRLQVVDRVSDPDLTSFLQVFKPQPGDAFFIPNQRVHSIGPGNLIWEVQERAAPALALSSLGSDVEPSAEVREQALQAIYFQDRQLPRIPRETSGFVRTRKIPLVHHCPRFTIDEVRLCDHIFDRTTGGSCHLLGTVQGAVEIDTSAGVEQLGQGSVACIPAALGEYRIRVVGKPASLLRVALQPGR